MITEHEIPIPRWDITDPFGRAAIRRARWEYKRKAAECESLHYELGSVYADRDCALTKLVEANNKLQEKLDATEKLLRRSDDGRVAMATKASNLSKQLSKTEQEIDYYKTEYVALKDMYDELEKEHERVIRGITDKEEIA